MFTEAKRGRLIDIVKQCDHERWNEESFLLIPSDYCFHLVQAEISHRSGKNHYISSYRKARLKKLKRQLDSLKEDTARKELEEKVLVKIDDHIHRFETKFEKFLWKFRFNFVHNIREDLSQDEEDTTDTRQVVNPASQTACISFDKPDQEAIKSNELLKAMDSGNDLAIFIVCNKGQYSGNILIRKGTPWMAVSGSVGVLTHLVCKKVTEEVSSDMFDQDKFNGFSDFISHVRTSVEEGIEKGQQEGLGGGSTV